MTPRPHVRFAPLIAGSQVPWYIGEIVEIGRVGVGSCRALVLAPSTREAFLAQRAQEGIRMDPIFLKSETWLRATFYEVAED